MKIRDAGEYGIQWELKLISIDGILRGGDVYVPVLAYLTLEYFLRCGAASEVRSEFFVAHCTFTAELRPEALES